MEKLNRQIKDLAILYEEYQKKEKENKNKHTAIKFLNKCLEILEMIDYSQIPDQSYVKRLDVILELILSEDWSSQDDKNKYLQSRINILLTKVQERYNQIQELKQKELKNHYKDIDEWVSEKHFLQVYDSKSKRQMLDLSVRKYENEYSLFLDMRDILLTKGISCQNAKYFYKIATQIEEELELDVEKGRITISEGVTELLNIAKLTRKNPNFAPSKDMQKKIDETVKRKILLQATEKYYF